MSREADPRIPFPHTNTPLACRTDPDLFAHEYGQSSSTEDRARTERARRTCRGCPIAAGCLKWALANPSLTPTGIWAATNSRERTVLRRRLQARHGLDWVGVVAEADRTRALRTPGSVLAPSASPTPAGPYEPWRESVTPGQQRGNRQLLNQT